MSTPQDGQPTEAPEEAPRPRFDALRAYLVTNLAALGLAGISDRLPLIGAVFNSAKQLRNDSNYEALLIAHEYQHELMTPAFASLASEMQRAAEAIVLLALEGFRNYLDHDPSLGEQREATKSLVSDYLESRLHDAVARKVRPWPDLMKRLDEVVDSLRPATTDRVDYLALERWISIATFGPKSALMREFGAAISELQANTSGLLRR